MDQLLAEGFRPLGRILETEGAKVGLVSPRVSETEGERLKGSCSGAGVHRQ